jgi:acetolactate synthase-1/2/3 large subunit
MPRDTIYVDETVTHRPLVGRHLTWTEPQSYFYVNGALGQGLGVALGVKLASPKRPVALLIGDGSFLYNPVIQGLGASRDQSLPLLIVVFNNRKYRAMQDNHTEYYPDGVAASSGIFYGTHINGPDYSELGRPFDFGGRRVSAASELRDVICDAKKDVAGGKTSILNIELSR